MKRANSGFVLPLTLIVIALLSALSFGMSQMVRNDMEDIQLRKSQWEDEKLALDIMHQSIYVLTVGDYKEQEVVSQDIVLPINSEPYKMGVAVVSIQDGAGLYSFAVFNHEKFKRLVERLTDKDTALKVSMELADWMDVDDRRQFKGKEQANYISEGLLQSPRNAPIRNIDELMELPSMTAEIMNGSDNQKGLRDLVLAGGGAHFNIATAPNILVGPVLGVSIDRESQILAARERKDWNSVLSLVNQHDWVFNDRHPFAKGSRYRLIIEGKSGYRTRGQVELTPYHDEGVFGLIEWQSPDYLYE